MRVAQAKRLREVEKENARLPMIRDGEAELTARMIETVSYVMNY